MRDERSVLCKGWRGERIHRIHTTPTQNLDAWRDKLQCLRNFFPSFDYSCIPQKPPNNREYPDMAEAGERLLAAGQSAAPRRDYADQWYFCHPNVPI